MPSFERSPLGPWVLGQAGWRSISDVGPRRCSPAMAVDAKNNRLIVTGGTGPNNDRTWP